MSENVVLGLSNIVTTILLTVGTLMVIWGFGGDPGWVGSLGLGLIIGLLVPLVRQAAN